MGGLLVLCVLRGRGRDHVSHCLRLSGKIHQDRQSRARYTEHNHENQTTEGSGHAPPGAAGNGSSSLRDRLLGEIAETQGEEALAVWAKGAIALKNSLTEEDARAVEAAYLAKLGAAPDSQDSALAEAPAPAPQQEPEGSP